MAKKHKKEETQDSDFDSSIAWKIATAVLAIALLASIFTSGFRDFNMSDTTTNAPTTGVKGDNTYADDDAFLGNANAPVVIIEWSEYLCPFCTRFHEQTFPSLKKDYIDTGKVKFVYRDYIIHGDAAQQISEAVECAGEQGKYFEMHDKVFAATEQPTVALLKQFATELGLDTTKFNTCADTRAMKAEVEKDQADGQKAGIRGTPGFLINGKLVSGAQPYDVFKTEIEAALAGGAAAPTAPTEPTAPDTVNDPKIQFTVITDSTCSLCDTSNVVDVTKTQLFPSIEVNEVDYNTPEGKALAQKYQIDALPAYIFDSNVEKAANFVNVAPALIKVDDSYVIDPGQTGAPKVMNPPGIDDDAVKGNVNAPITIIEFSDYECPYCGKFYTETYSLLEENYIKTGKVKFVFRDFPLDFHPQAQKAAEAAECAGEQNKYYEMHNKLFVNQASLSVENEKKWAQELGLDSAAFNDCLDSGKMAAEIQKDMAEGQAAGVSGTPAFFIGNYKVSGAMPYEVFDSILKEIEGEQT